MVNSDVTIAIPVGPYEANQKWLEEALDSCAEQTVQPAKVLLIDDMANVSHIPYTYKGLLIGVYQTPWNVGVSQAFNFGVALAPTPLVIMLGSDDTLHPEAVEYALRAYANNKKRDAYYYFSVKYMDTGEEQNLPCNAAMVTQGLWRMTGGFPVETPIAPDAAYVSILLKHRPGSLVAIAERTPLYNYRRHAETDTRQHGAWHTIAIESRNLATLEWKPPAWKRYART